MCTIFKVRAGKVYNIASIKLDRDILMRISWPETMLTVKTSCEIVICLIKYTWG